MPRTLAIVAVAAGVLFNFDGAAVLAGERENVGGGWTWQGVWNVNTPDDPDYVTLATNSAEGYEWWCSISKVRSDSRIVEVSMTCPAGDMNGPEYHGRYVFVFVEDRKAYLMSAFWGGDFGDDKELSKPELAFRLSDEEVILSSCSLSGRDDGNGTLRCLDGLPNINAVYDGPPPDPRQVASFAANYNEYCFPLLTPISRITCENFKKTIPVYYWTAVWKVVNAMPIGQVIKQKEAERTKSEIENRRR